MKRLPLLTLALLLATGAFAASPNVVISQIYGAGGNSGATYANDFIELYNTSSSPVVMTNWQVAYASAAGTSWTNRTVFSGTIAAHGYFLIQEASGGANGIPLPTPDVIDTGINMSATAGKLALLSNNTGIGAIGCPPTAGTTGLVDFIGYGTAADCHEGSANAPVQSTSKSDTRTAGNVDTDQNGTDFVSQTVNPRNAGASSITLSSLSPNSAVAGGGAFTLFVNGAGFTSPATVNFNGTQITASAVTASQVSATIPASLIATAGPYPVSVSAGGSTSSSLTFTVTVPCNPTLTISQIQGNGTTSQYTGSSQSAIGIVTLIQTNGFFMQSASGDGDPNTSDGIHVFTTSAPTVSVGDMVCVSATVAEFNGGSVTDPLNTLTELDTPTITKISTANTLPAPVTLSPDAAGSKDQLERYEGMRVQIASLTTTSPTGGTVDEVNATSTSNGAFFGVVTGTPRPFREPGVEVSHPIASTLPPCCIPLFDGNPEKISIFTGQPGVTKLDVVTGAVVSNIVGVLDVHTGYYQVDVEPATAPVVSNNTLPVTVVPQQLPSELTIGTFNLERFYDTTNDPSTSDVILTAAAFQKRLQKASLAIRNVDMMPDILGVEEMENLSTLQTLAAQISADAIAAGQPDPQYTAYLAEGNDIGGIDVGFLVKPSRVSVTSVTQYGLTTTYIDPTSGNPAILNDRPPLVLTGTAHNGAKAGLPVIVIVNHLKALPADDPTDARVRAKREAQAEFLANLIQSFQTATPNAIIASVGDYNAFEINDGMVDVLGAVKGTPVPANQVLVASPAITNPPLTELSQAFLQPALRYSYVETGNAQQLDHILVSAAALNRVSRFAIGHVNADFPEIFRNDATRPERFSDHDPEVAYLNLPAADDFTASVSMTSSGLVFNRATQVYNGTVTITNLTSSTIGAPVQVTFTGLPAGVTLSNATGTLGGTPFISTSSVGANGSVTIPVQFRITGSARVGYTLNLYSGTL